MWIFKNSTEYPYNKGIHRRECDSSRVPINTESSSYWKNGQLTFNQTHINGQTNAFGELFMSLCLPRTKQFHSLVMQIQQLSDYGHSVFFFNCMYKKNCKRNHTILNSTTIQYIHYLNSSCSLCECFLSIWVDLVRILFPKEHPFIKLL